MKLDDIQNALIAARELESAKAEEIARALMEAHLEGIDQARSLFIQGLSAAEIRAQLDARRQYIERILGTK